MDSYYYNSYVCYYSQVFPEGTWISFSDYKELCEKWGQPVQPWEKNNNWLNHFETLKGLGLE